MNDYFYWNQTNVGAGIERMNLGAGKFSVAVLLALLLKSGNYPAVW